MAISKVILNGTTLMDVTQDTVAADKVLYGETAHKNDGTSITGNIASKTSSDLIASGATVTVPAGYYASNASKNVVSGSEGTPTATKGTVSNHSITVTPSVTNSAGYISGSTKTGTAVTVSASELVSGTKSITSSGTTDVTNYANASVDAGTITNNTSGGTSAGTINRGSQIKIGAGMYDSDVYYTAQGNSGTKTISDSGITSVDGYANVSIAAGTEGTPTATKGSVNNNSISITPSVTNTTGYITGNTITGTAVTVSANELVNGTLAINSAGTKDVTNYASASIAEGSAITPDTTVTANPMINIDTGTGLITASVSTSENITPTVSAGYVSSGTAGTISISGSNTEQLSTLGATTYNPSTTDQTIAAGKYLTGAQTIKGINIQNLNVTPTTSQQVFNGDGIIKTIPSGYYTNYGSYQQGESIFNISASELTPGETYYVQGEFTYNSKIVTIDDNWTYTINGTYISSNIPYTCNQDSLILFVGFRYESQLFTVRVNNSDGYPPITITTPITFTKVGVYDGYLPITVAPIPSEYVDISDTTVTAEDVLNQKYFYTADGTKTQGTRVINLQNKEVTIEDDDFIVPGGDVFCYFYEEDAINTWSTVLRSTTASKLKTLDTSKNYNIIGKIIILDNSGIVEIININTALDPSASASTGQPVMISSNDYISSCNFKWQTINSSFQWYHKSGTYGLKIQLKVVEINEQYDGISTLDVKVANYGLYKCLIERKAPLIASGSSSYGYTAQDVSNWCNYFHNIVSGNGLISNNISVYQFTGIRFSGSFYFNNIQSFQYYAFAIPHFDVTTGPIYSADLYFPQLQHMGSITFAYNRDINYIEALSCKIIGGSAFRNCAYLKSINIPLCERIESYAFSGCAQLSTISCSLCSYIGNQAFIGCQKLEKIYFPICQSIGNSTFAQCYILSSANFPSCTTIGISAFGSCSSLTTISFPECTSIGNNAFFNCISLTTASFPECTYVSAGAFSSCTSLTDVYLPKVSLIGTYAFQNCYNLNTISLPACTIIYNYAFSSCYNLLSLYLMGSSYVSLSNISAFRSTPIANYTTSTNGVQGSIYVPSSMLDTYKTMTNWVTYSSRFVGI